MKRPLIHDEVLISMKVVCIKNTYKGTTYKGTHMDLTYGKAYEVIDQQPFQINEQMYQIIDDKGTLAWYDREVVIPLDEWREERLNEIL